MGKTSLVNVAAYKCFKKYIVTHRAPLLIPCKHLFQIRPNQDVELILERLYLEVAQTLLDHRLQLERLGFSLEGADSVDRWLNEPEQKSFQASLGGVGGGHFRTAGSPIYTEAGFRRRIVGWLKELFPTYNSGGVVCVLDNLEILGETREARYVLEQIRDPVLGIQGVRWVMCGSQGLKSSLCGSPRLDGTLHAPVELKSLCINDVARILSSRKRAFSIREAETYLPLTETEFLFYYQLLHGNLRYTLSGLGDYCLWISDQATCPKSLSSMRSAFKDWLRKTSLELHRSTRMDVGPVGWALFDRIVEQGDVQLEIRFEDFEQVVRSSVEKAEGLPQDDDLALNSELRLKSVFNQCLDELKSADLLVRLDSKRDEKRYHATSKAWQIRYARKLEFGSRRHALGEYRIAS